MNLVLYILGITIILVIAYWKKLGLHQVDYSKLKFWGKKSHDQHPETENHDDRSASHHHQKSFWSVLWDWGFKIIIGLGIILLIVVCCQRESTDSFREFFRNEVAVYPNTLSSKIHLEDGGDKYVLTNMDCGDDESFAIHEYWYDKDLGMQEDVEYYKHGQTLHLKHKVLYLRLQSTTGKKIWVDYALEPIS